jgi:hypothetical protein
VEDYIEFGLQMEIAAPLLLLAIGQQAQFPDGSRAKIVSLVNEQYYH